jgi:hypothetical protein
MLRAGFEETIRVFELSIIERTLQLWYAQVEIESVKISDGILQDKKTSGLKLNECDLRRRSQLCITKKQQGISSYIEIWLSDNYYLLSENETVCK